MDRLIRVLLVDDHALMLDGLRSLLADSEHIDVVATAPTGADALESYETLRPDVAIVDIRMRPMDGVQLTAAIRAIDPSAKVVLLSTYETEEDVFRGFQAGAWSYLVKDVALTRLVDVVRSVHAGRRDIDPSIAVKLASHAGLEALTVRQAEVLSLISAGQSNLEIANALFISEGTVKAHVKAILRKLNARDRTQALTVAMRRGLLRA